MNESLKKKKKKKKTRKRGIIVKDFAFFCVWTNEISASSPFAQLFSLAKTLQRSGT